jgi:cell wall-associated NlpC family hydrolase
LGSLVISGSCRSKRGILLSSLRLLVALVAMAVLVTGTHLEAAPAEARHTEQHKVMRFAKNQIGKPYKWGATGLRRYDCSGLIYRTYKEAGVLRKIGGSRKTSRGYFRWFRDRGLITKKPRRGDLVVWGKSRVTHIGIFAGYNRKGRPMAISALHKGMSRHRVHAINVPFRAYLRVRLQR